MYLFVLLLLGFACQASEGNGKRNPLEDGLALFFVRVPVLAKMNGFWGFGAANGQDLCTGITVVLHFVVGGINEQE